jgi:hypothetical protein
MTMMLAPSRAVLSGGADHKPDEPAPDADHADGDSPAAQPEPEAAPVSAQSGNGAAQTTDTAA